MELGFNKMFSLAGKILGLQLDLEFLICFYGEETDWIYEHISNECLLEYLIYEGKL